MGIEWVFVALKFVKKYWKQLAVVAAAGLLVLTVSTLWGKLYVAQGEVIKLEATIGLMEAKAQVKDQNMARCVAANKTLAEQLKLQDNAQAEIIRRSQQYATRLQDELEARAADQLTIEELSASLDNQVTAVECPAAVDQLIMALGWGPEVEHE